MAVCDYGGITAAASKLHMTQPAVSIQVKQPEDYYGVSLLEVVGKKSYTKPLKKQLPSCVS